MTWLAPRSARKAGLRSATRDPCSPCVHTHTRATTRQHTPARRRSQQAAPVHPVLIRLQINHFSFLCCVAHRCCACLLWSVCCCAVCVCVCVGVPTHRRWTRHWAEGVARPPSSTSWSCPSPCCACRSASVSATTRMATLQCGAFDVRCWRPLAVRTRTRRVAWCCVDHRPCVRERRDEATRGATASRS